MATTAARSEDDSNSGVPEGPPRKKHRPKYYNDTDRSIFFQTYDSRPAGTPLLTFCKQHENDSWCPTQGTALRWLQVRQEQINLNSPNPEQRRRSLKPKGRPRLDLRAHVEAVATGKLLKPTKKQRKEFGQQVGFSYATLRRRMKERERAPPVVLAFDLYGTLLATESIANTLAAFVGKVDAIPIAQLWRRYQLEYTWRANSMGVYQDFFTYTHRSLLHALAEFDITLAQEQIDTLMSSYNNLLAFPDVVPMLQCLSQHSHLTNKKVVFSNGTQAMVATSILSSPDLGPFAAQFDDLVTVEECKKYKPAPEVYRHLARNVGKNPDDAADMARIWIVSGNAFDVVGARNVGMNAIWVDREGKGRRDRMMGDSGPSRVVRSLVEVVGVLEEVVREGGAVTGTANIRDMAPAPQQEEEVEETEDLVDGTEALSDMT